MAVREEDAGNGMINKGGDGRTDGGSRDGDGSHSTRVDDSRKGEMKQIVARNEDERRHCLSRMWHVWHMADRSITYRSLELCEWETDIDAPSPPTTSQDERKTRTLASIAQPYENVEMEAGNFLDMIRWDDETPSKRSPYLHLLLDANDAVRHSSSIPHSSIPHCLHFRLLRSSFYFFPFSISCYARSRACGCRACVRVSHRI